VTTVGTEKERVTHTVLKRIT